MLEKLKAKKAELEAKVEEQNAKIAEAQAVIEATQAKIAVVDELIEEESRHAAVYSPNGIKVTPVVPTTNGNGFVL